MATLATPQSPGDFEERQDRRRHSDPEEQDLYEGVESPKAEARAN
jgi:hypothetical protein